MRAPRATSACAVFAGLSLFLGVQDAEAFDIAKGGRPAAVIATGANPPATSVRAAKELAGYLGKMSGGAFEVVEGDAPAGQPAILVGIPYATTNHDEICLRAEGGSLVLTGQQPRGPIYAVYELLERLGCGFWADDNETVPSSPDIAVADDLDFVDAPFFRLRANCGTTAVYNPLWCVKARLNGHGGIPEDLGGWYFVDMDESTVGLNHGELQRENYAKHPEWYSYIHREKGRVPEQICLTNPEALAKLRELARARMEANPDLEYIPCSYADAAPACECPKCTALAEREGTKAALLLNAANLIARDLAPDYPNVKITVLAYGWNSIVPPKHMKLEPQVVCIFANLARDYARPPSGDGALRRWCELTGGQVYIWGYGAMFHNYIMPTPTVDLIAQEMRVYKGLGCLGISSQLSQDQCSDCIDLLCWLFGKMAWNPDADEWALIDKWCDGALGAGSPFIKKWLRMERDYRPNIKGLGPYVNDNRVCLSPELLLEGNALFLDALEAVKDDPRATRQLEQMYGSILSVMVERYNFDVASAVKAAQAKPGEAARLRLETLPSREEYYRQFAATCKKHKGGWLGEGQGGALARIHHGEILRHNGRPPPWTFQNPVSKTPSQDPFVTWDATNGCYYLLHTCGDQVEIRRGKNASKLLDEGERSVAWRPPSKGSPIAGNIMAPELHRGDDGKWYIYASGSDGMTMPAPDPDVDFGDMGAVDLALDSGLGGGDSLLAGGKTFTDLSEISENRLFVLQSKTDDPFGGFEFKGILDKTISAVDPTIFRGPDGALYMAYAKQSEGTSIVMRKMKGYLAFDPASKGVPVVHAHGASELFEAPSVLAIGDRLFLVYSAFGRWSNDGRLLIRELVGKDVCRTASWGGRAARDFLISGNRLDSSDEGRDKYAQCFGPGHASFFPSPDGSELWCAFHGMQRPNSGTGPADVYMCQQRVDFGEDGAPDMGKPEIAGVDPRQKGRGPATFFLLPSGEPWEDAAAAEK